MSFTFGGLGGGAKPGAPAFGQPSGLGQRAPGSTALAGGLASTGGGFGASGGSSAQPAAPPPQAASAPAFGLAGGALAGAALPATATPAPVPKVAGPDATGPGAPAISYPPMPDALKNGAKAALAASPDGYKTFVATVKALKDGSKTHSQCVAEVQTLLASRPDLFAQFKTWCSSSSTVPVAAADSSRLPAAAAEAAGEASSAVGQSMQNDEAIRAPNVLTDVLLQSHVLQGSSEAAELAHMQAFSHSSRTFAYALKHPDNAQPQAQSYLAPVPSESHGRQGVSVDALSDRHGAAHPLGPSPFQNRSRALTPELPIKLGGGFRQLQLDATIRHLDALLLGVESKNASRGDLSSVSSPHSTPRSSRTPREDSLGRERAGYFTDADARTQHDEMPEWKRPLVRPKQCFLTKRQLQGAEAAQAAYYATRMQHVSGPLSKLQAVSSQLTRDLAALKQKFGTSCNSLGSVSSCEEREPLLAAMQTLGQVEAELQTTLTPMARCWTLLEFGNTPDVVSEPMLSARQAVLESKETATKLLADITAKRSECIKQLDEIKRVRNRRLVYHHARIAFNATLATSKLIEERKSDATAAACKRMGAAHAEVLEAADPRLFKNALSLAEWEQRLTEFASKRDSQRGPLDERDSKLRALILALVLLRADSKKDALTLTMTLAQHLPELPRALVRLCLARSVSLLPYYADVLSPFKDQEGTRIYHCQLGLPDSSAKDKRRVAVALDQVTPPPKLAGDVSITDTVIPTTRPVARQVFEVAPFCKLGDKEWVLVLPDEPPAGVQGVVVRRGLFSEKSVHDKGALMVPHIMMPEGSSGVTELYARLLVRFAQAPSPPSTAVTSEEWEAYKPFGWMYPAATETAPAIPESERRTPREHLFAWLACAARFCHVSSEVPTAREKERVKYMVQHMHPFLQVAAHELLEAYPVQTAKVATALRGSSLVMEVLQSFKSQQTPTLSTLLEVLAGGGGLNIEARITKLAQLQAEAEAVASGQAASEVPPVVMLLETDLPLLPADQQQLLDKLAADKVGKSVMGTKNAVKKKCDLLSRTLSLTPLQSDEGEQSNRGVNYMRVAFGEAQAGRLRDIIRAKLAERLVNTVVQTNAKMFTLQGGFEGYAWAAVLTSLAKESDEGKLQLKWILHLIHREMPHVEAAAEPEHRIVTTGQAESRGVVNLFASLMQSEEMPLEVAAEIGELLIAKGTGKEIAQKCALPSGALFSGGTNSAILLRLWVEAFCAKGSLAKAKGAVASSNPAELSSALERLENAAEIAVTILAVAGRIWDQKYVPFRTTHPSGFPLLDPSMEHRNAILKLLSDTLLAPPLVGACCQPTHQLYSQTVSLRALRRLLDCLHWFPFDGSSPPQPDWNETVEGGKLRMQDAGLAEGDRTLSDMIKFDD